MSRAADWPAFRHDNRRSGSTSEKIDAASLGRAWVHRPAHPPQPAWPGPARWDAYVKRPVISSMRDYDVAHHPIVVGDAVYYASSADDAVHCLDARTGRERWRFTTGGPVRIPPTWHHGKLYLGSDDGAAYCITADKGMLVWRSSPTAGRRLVLNDGRPISRWPVRTGVTIDNGIAYFGASLLPWKESYLCAVDAKTGQAAGADPRVYVTKHEGLTLEGPLVVSGGKIFATQGRTAPFLFNQADGRALGQLRTTGGSFALLTADNVFLVGPGPKEGYFSRVDGASGKSDAKFVGGRVMAAAGDTCYVLEPTVLGAIQPKTVKWLWRVPCGFELSVVHAGGTIFAGGRDRVRAVNAADGKTIAEYEVDGDAHGLAVARGALYVSTDDGAIHCFRPNAGKKDTSPRQGAVQPKKKPAAPVLPAVPPEIVIGPYLQFVAPGEAVVRWRTAAPSPTILRYGWRGLKPSFEDRKPKTAHEARLKGLRRNRVYSYVITTVVDGKEKHSPAFGCDTHFNYALGRVLNRPHPYPKTAGVPLAEAAARIVRKSAARPGVCVVLGAGDGRLAYELAAASRFRVVVLETDAKRVPDVRRRFHAAGIYGVRATVLQVPSYDKLPLPSSCANLIVSDEALTTGKLIGSAADVHRVLRPGGVALIGQPPDARKRLTAEALTQWLDAAKLKYELRRDGGLWAKIVRGPLPGAGEWTHQYGRADNAAYGGEMLGGATSADDFEVQWIGRPGPRYQSDRQNRKAAPLSVGGRLFLQGLERIIALDAHSGIILWALEIPGLRRFNVRADSANWCADAKYVYAAIRDKCWQIDAATGKVVRFHDAAPAGKRKWKWDWGYVGNEGGLLFGSAVKQGAAYQEFWGGQYWYDQEAGPLTHKVCSDNLFAIDKKTGRTLWTYEGGVIINTSITAAAGTAWFVESRHPAVRALDTRRIGAKELWQQQFLVALDSRTGRKRWERPIDTDDGITMFSMAHGGGKPATRPAGKPATRPAGKLVIVASAPGGGGRFHVAVFDAANGRPAWESRVKWLGRNKGAHLSRPAIVGDVVYVWPTAFELATGRKLHQKMVRGTCGTYAAASGAIISRIGNLGIWSPKTGKVTNWRRLRPDCWLSTIPASGMILSPEGGGGCSCGGWLETSIGFAPVRDRVAEPPPAK